MKRPLWLGIWMAAAVAGTTATAWESLQFDLPSQAPEALWRDYLSEELGAQHEVKVEGGRVDVMTETEVIEIDWPHKWHEGFGQALHYAGVTGKRPVLAIISYSQDPDKLTAASREKFEMIEKNVSKHGVKLIVLFPSQQRLYDKEGGREAQYGGTTNFWLNVKTGIRHRPGCRFYGTGADGRPCGEKEGKACSICGR